MTRTIVAMSVLALALAGCSAEPAPGVASPASSPTRPGPLPTQGIPTTSPSVSPPASPSVSPTPSPTVSRTSAPTAGGTTAIPTTGTTVQRAPGWALDRIDQRGRKGDSRYVTTHAGEGVTIYQIDGRYDVGNAEFEGRASVGLKQGDVCTLESGINHGLFVAGILAGRHTGVAKKAKVVSIGMASQCEGGDQRSREDFAQSMRDGLAWIAANAHRPAVVNLSLGYRGDLPGVKEAVKRLIDTGIPVVAAAGNDGRDACGQQPASFAGVISVTASTKTDEPAGLNYGKCVNLFAPGAQVTSVVTKEIDPDLLVTEEGAATSWATPYVSGAVALYLSAHPDASVAQVRSWLFDGATTGAIRGDLRGTPNRLLYVGKL